MEDRVHSKGAVIIGGDFQGLGIARNLAYLNIPVVVVDPDFCIGRFSRYIDACYRCPPLTDAGAFISFLIKLCVEHNLKYWIVYPTSDRAVCILSQFKELLSGYYCIPTPNWEITKYAYDKRETQLIAEKLGIPAPRTIFPNSRQDLERVSLGFPVILKPTIKENFFPKTKRKAIGADNSEELLKAYQYMTSIIPGSEVMIQELIKGGPSNLYSFCSLFSNGQLKARLVARRARQHPMDFGNATTFAVTCDMPELEEFAVRLLGSMNYHGLSEVEFMYDGKDKTFKLLEINPRTWGWHTLGARAGVNFSALLFMELSHRPYTSNDFEKNVKWVRLLTDTAIVISEMYKGRLGLREYIRSLKGKKEYAVCSLRDPLPFIVEVLLAPYFYYKRGF